MRKILTALPAGEALYGGTIFTSALLLFSIQPIVAKAILPWFGGSAGVWTTCLFFFQAVLVLGYLYAHWTTRFLHRKLQVAIHAALLALSLFVLPITVSDRWKFSDAGAPVLRILALLSVTVGLPYLLLSTTGPLVQAWHAGKFARGVPYRLFAVSNAASLLALLAYPVAVEPALSIRHQLQGWSIAYIGFAVLAAGSAAVSRAAAAPKAQSSGLRRGGLLWIALAACAGTLWLAIANHLSQAVAPVPFLWILPLSLYLLSFILCFQSEAWYSPRLYQWLLPAAWMAMCYQFIHRSGLVGSILVFAGALFVCCMFCHGELARRKPEPRELTRFYLMIALGGALGGAFVGLLAPLVFTGYVELPIALAACFVLALALIYGYSSERHLLRLGAVSAIALVVAIQVRAYAGKMRFEARNFYGTLQVSDTNGVRTLYNGTIAHGVQFLADDRSRLATGYYGPRSGAGLAITERHRRVGVVGLGAGTLATYGRGGDYFRFYDINPLVIQVAQREFRFLREAEAKVDVVPGDARLSLEREDDQNFDVLAVDAFSGDSIPIHLLTKEAFALYFRHLKPEGILAVHVTNKYLNLAPVVKALADAFQKQARLVQSPAETDRQIYQAEWVLVAGQWSGPGRPMTSDGRTRVWTDDYSNLFRVLR